jgi:disulfide oxidoreductase YuzD
MYSAKSFTIQPRNEYSNFSFDESNRDVSDSHLEKIYDAIENMYLLDVFPIVTDNNGVIQDGQHRYTVAKYLKIPFYAIPGDIGIEDVSLTNRNTKPYSTEDVLLMYAKMGMEPYVIANEIKEKYKRLPAGYIAKLLGCTSNDSFIESNFVITRLLYAKRVCRYLDDLSKIQKFVMSSSAYRCAIEFLAKTVEYDHSRMVDRVSRIATRLITAGTKDEALEVLESIYNYNIREENRMEFKRFSINTEVEKPIGNCDRVQPTRGILHKYPVTVDSSMNYNEFSLHPCRREHSTFSINAMIESVRQSDWLHLYPIVVNEDMVILDGQRRFEAAKALCKPIWYIQVKNVSMPMMIIAGTRKLSWSLKDYLKHYIKRGKQDYIDLKMYVERYGIALNTYLLATDEPMHSISCETFRKGEYKISNRKIFTEWSESISRIKNPSLRAGSGTAFWRFLKSDSLKSKLPAVIEHINNHPSEWIDLTRLEVSKKILTMGGMSNE